MVVCLEALKEEHSQHQSFRQNGAWNGRFYQASKIQDKYLGESFWQICSDVIKSGNPDKWLVWKHAKPKNLILLKFLTIMYTLHSYIYVRKQEQRTNMSESDRRGAEGDRTEAGEVISI